MQHAFYDRSCTDYLRWYHSVIEFSRNAILTQFWDPEVSQFSFLRSWWSPYPQPPQLLGCHTLGQDTPALIYSGLDTRQRRTNPLAQSLLALFRLATQSLLTVSARSFPQEPQCRCSCMFPSPLPGAWPWCCPYALQGMLGAESHKTVKPLPVSLSLDMHVALSYLAQGSMIKINRAPIANWWVQRLRPALKDE